MKELTTEQITSVTQKFNHDNTKLSIRVRQYYMSEEIEFRMCQKGAVKDYRFATYHKNDGFKTHLKNLPITYRKYAKSFLSMLGKADDRLFLFLDFDNAVKICNEFNNNHSFELIGCVKFCWELDNEIQFDILDRYSTVDLEDFERYTFASYKNLILTVDLDSIPEPKLTMAKEFIEKLKEEYK